MRKNVTKNCDETISQNKNTLFFHSNLTKTQVCKFVAF